MKSDGVSTAFAIIMEEIASVEEQLKIGVRSCNARSSLTRIGVRFPTLGPPCMGTTPGHDWCIPAG